MGFEGYLRQLTAATVRVGPLVDSTNGDSEETGLVITQNDVIIIKNGASTAVISGTAVTPHLGFGNYKCALGTADVNTVGLMTIHCHPAGALYASHTYAVLPAVVYDSFIAGSDYFQTDVTQIEGTDATDSLDTRIRGVMGTSLLTVGVNIDKTGYSGTAALVTGNVNGNVIGTVAVVSGNILGNVNGNVIGTVAALTGAVASVTGNVGGNVVGNINGNVVGTVGALTSNRDKAGYQGTAVSVSDKTGYTISTNQDKTGYTVSTVQDKTGYSLAVDQSIVTIGTVVSVTAVAGAVASVTGNVGGNIVGNVNGNVIGTIGYLTTNKDKAGYQGTAVSVSDKTGYTVSTVQDKTGYTVSTVQDKSGYSLAIDQSAVTIGTVNALSTAGKVAMASAIFTTDMDQVEDTAPKHSLISAVLKAVSKIEDDGGTIKVYQTDGVTLHMSQVSVTDSALDPIDSLTVGA